MAAGRGKSVGVMTHEQDAEEMQTVECCRTYLTTKDGKRFLIEESALIELLAADVLLADQGDDSVKLLVNCSDLFWWGTADGEPIRYEDIEPLYIAWKVDGDLGALRWACVKRGLRPQYGIEQQWRRDGAWTAELEALPRRDIDFFNPKIEPT